MKTTTDIAELLAEYNTRIERSLEDFKFKESGGNDPEENRKFNAMMYHLEDAYESLKKGLDGKF
jgi:hypothetical protein